MRQTPQPYLHGFSKEEQQRLIAQSRHAEAKIFEGLDFNNTDHLLEVGVGVGAQTKILLERFPHLTVTGIDQEQVQMAAARQYLTQFPAFNGRWDLRQMSAYQLELAENSVGGVFFCWVLEHLSAPQTALNEAFRVMRPGTSIFANEVMNHTFFLDPKPEHLWTYWETFMSYQQSQAGDPNIGARLGDLFHKAGFTAIRTEPKTWNLDARHPAERSAQLQFWCDLILSGAPKLLEQGLVTPQLVEGVTQDFQELRSRSDTVFYYSFMQAFGTKPQP